MGGLAQPRVVTQVGRSAHWVRGHAANTGYPPPWDNQPAGACPAQGTTTGCSVVNKRPLKESHDSRRTILESVWKSPLTGTNENGSHKVPDLEARIPGVCASKEIEKGVTVSSDPPRHWLAVLCVLGVCLENEVLLLLQKSSKTKNYLVI